MLYLYPANRMEDLLLLFAKVQQISPLPPMTEELVLVQNQGMQHWLNMQQAEANHVSMNTRFSLPAQFFWKTLRALCSDQLPEQSPYSRDVLAWRIELLLQSDEIIADPNCQPLTLYWHSHTGPQQALRRYQLARKIADLYEQYLIYRPDWIHAWSIGESIELTSDSAHVIEEWQSLLWQKLNQQIPYDPQQLIHQAIANLANRVDILPKRISLFGLNAIAPIWMEFLAALGKHIDIHFYQLNPCIEYWGDVKSEKSKARQAFQQLLAGWPDMDQLNEHINPLLANLGQQGKDLLSQLQQFEHIEIPVYERLSDAQLTASTVLAQLQNDILTLHDRRESSVASHVDDSIVISSAHSALREVQGLHDYLLHQFNKDPELTPKDVLVMCPQVEDYAPYIDAVFVRGWEDIGENIPPLPCSIADRVSKDSEPLVNGFNDLLNLPDSRFEVSKLISYLQLKPVQKRFQLSDADIELISFWLEQANIHWGLDGSHKARMIGAQSASEMFTWKLGLQRLLRGFAYGDQLSLDEDNLFLPWVEGDNSLLLGKLMLFLEHLQQLQRLLNQPRTASDWYQLLTDWLERLFAEDEQEQDNGLLIIRQAIDSLLEHCQQAGYTSAIHLWPIREYLNTHFSEPDPGRQFMIGQITFCSMLPMRSIPFKLVAVLGLNDGQFPRQRQPIGFDLMAMTPSRLGDRSLHKDDRYLFLEALISARHNLYLSYQGRDIKNNGERQPSIVLRELMDYLQAGFSWQFTPSEQLRQLPMQAFSQENYVSHNRWRSFDGKWLNLTASQQSLPAETDGSMNATPMINSTVAEVLQSLAEEQQNTLYDDDLIQLLRHPSKLFGSRQLNLSFGYQQQPLQDTEPFAVNALDKFNFKQGVLKTLLQTASAKPTILDQELVFDIDHLQKMELLSGRFPDRSDTEDQLQQWRQLIEAFGHYVHDVKQAVELHANPVDLPITIDFPLLADDELLRLQTNLELFKHPQGFTLMQAKGASANEVDLCQLYVAHLLACAYAIDNGVDSVSSSAWFLNEKKMKIEEYQLSFWSDAKEVLVRLITEFANNYLTPKPVTMGMARKHFWLRNKFHPGTLTQAELEKLWHQESFGKSLATDPYLQYFFPKCPQVENLTEDLSNLYQVFFERLEVKNIEIDEQVLALTTTSDKKLNQGSEL